MKQVLIQKGVATVVDVPRPTVNSGEVLVRVHASCISVGTEMTGVRASATPIWKRALKQPDKIATVFKKLATTGIKGTWRLIEEKRDLAYPVGYSASGVVIEVGHDVTDLAIGDRVACAGGGYAFHAEVIRVPRNLCVPITDDVDYESAATVTLGAIALQGVRRAQPTLGETFVVLGLGILGQLTVQLLRANGCRTIGVDLDRDRITRALSLGMDVGIHPDDDDDMQQVARMTNGFGADGVIITAATQSDAVVSSAFNMCRKKGRVVLVGDVGLNLNRDDFYAKEIDFFISSSYGPGRYDTRYEERGFDYPLAYVRWTENRNMAEYVRLVGEDTVRVPPLISARYPVGEASEAYASLNSDGPRPLMVLLTYPESSSITTQRVEIGSKPTRATGAVQVAVIGAGGFARSSHLPNIQAMKDRFVLRAVVAQTGHSASAAGKQYGAQYVSTDYREVLDDADIDAVVIATRHHLHGSIALAALKAGKHVLVEKPLVLTAGELDALDSFVIDNREDSPPVLLTGYNRRFSPFGRRMADLLSKRAGPFMMNYRMNAGYIPHDHWVHGPEGGGRNLGEACHIYDLFTFLADSEVESIVAHSIDAKNGPYTSGDNFTATIRFADGSVASLTYTALGNPDYPKETADLYVDGKLAILRDYIELDVYGNKKKSLTTKTQQKGFYEELSAFSKAIQTGIWPIPWWQQRQSMRIALAVNDMI